MEWRRGCFKEGGLKIRDLGVLSGPVIAYGGALGNLAALGALLREATRAGVPAARVICTGDIVGIGAQGQDCIAATRAFGGAVVAGNIEQQLAAGAADSGSGYAPGSVSRRLAAAWWAATGGEVGPDARGWMGDLPDALVFSHAGRRLAVLHGGASDVARFVWPTTPAEVIRQEIAAAAAATGPLDAVIAGHAGVAFERVVDGVSWINAGMIGLPPNDGRRGGRYLRLDEDGARIMRLDYDPAPAFAAMVAAGRTEGFDRTLLSGHWPSEDFLPQEMRSSG